MRLLTNSIKLTICLALLAFVPYFASAQATITVATSPKNLVNCYGSTGNVLTVVASASNPITYDVVYDWYKDGVEILGFPQKLAGNYTFSNLPLDYKMSGRYMVKLWCVGAGLPVNSPILSPIVSTPEIDVNVLELPQLVNKVPNQYAKIGDNLIFQATAHIYGFKNGTAPDYSISYQWYRGTKLLTDSGRYSGTKSSMFTIRDIKATDYDTTYRVVISGQCGSIGNGAGETFSILAPPTITIGTQPIDQTVCAGNWVSEKIKASINTSDKLFYQWYADSTKLFDIQGQITGSHTDSLAWMVNPGKLANVWCQVWINGNLASANSQRVNITGLTKPSISSITGDTPALKGKPLTLTIVATSVAGDTLTYQWWKDSTAIAGAVKDTYKVDSATSNDQGVYRVVVTGKCGTVTSTNVNVTVNAAGAIDVTSGVDNTFELNNGITAITPNPTNNLSVITFKNEVAQNVRLTLSNSAGANLAELLNENYTAGTHTLNLNLNEMNLSSGSYFLNITIGNWSQTKQIVIVR